MSPLVEIPKESAVIDLFPSSSTSLETIVSIFISCRVFMLLVQFRHTGLYLLSLTIHMVGQDAHFFGNLDFIIPVVIDHF